MKKATTTYHETNKPSASADATFSRKVVEYWPARSHRQMPTPQRMLAANKGTCICEFKAGSLSGRQESKSGNHSKVDSLAGFRALEQAKYFKQRRKKEPKVK